MSPWTMMWYLAGGAAALVAVLGISYWAVQYFVQQLSQQFLARFRAQLAHEVEHALGVFRDSMCEQIVQQGRKSDALSGLYAKLIEMLRQGREFCAGCGRDEAVAQEKRLRGVQESCRVFLELYQRESLHFSDEFRARLEGFGDQQRDVLELLVREFYRKDVAERAREKEIRQHWSHLEDRVSELMEFVRQEFQRRNQTASAFLLQGLKDQPRPDFASGHR